MKKKFIELTFTDHFMFEKVLQRNKKLCKRLIEICIGKKIKEIRYIDVEKRIEPSYDKKWIRLDVYAEDEDGNIYNLELQISDKDKNIPKRIQNSHTMIGYNSLGPTEDFNKRKDVYVIFIGLVDIYKCDHPALEGGFLKEKYSSKIHDANDGAHTIVLNAACPWLPSDDLGRFLRFLKTGVATDDFTKDLLHEVELVKHDKELEAEYKMFQDVIKDVLAEEEQQLIEKGKAEGKVEGKVEGEAEVLVNDVQNLMKNLESSITLEKACKILGHTAEEYNKALELLKAEKQ